MFEPSLAQAVEEFTHLTQSLPDTSLNSPWSWGAYDSEGVRFAFFRTYEELRELAAKIATKRHASGPIISTAQYILGQYHLAYRDLQASLLGLESQSINQSPSEREWSPRQIIDHIVGAEIGFYVVVRDALDRQRSGKSYPEKIPDEAWELIMGMDEVSYQSILEGPIDGILSFYESHHIRVLSEFADIQETELECPSVYWEGEPFSLRFRLHRFDSHLRQHTVQVDKTLARLGHPYNENQRLLRLISSALAEAEGATIGAWNIERDTIQHAADSITARVAEITVILNG
jgi:hypothetical protein